jgi:hypothetical protein
MTTESNRTSHLIDTSPRDTSPNPESDTRDPEDATAHDGRRFARLGRAISGGPGHRVARSAIAVLGAASLGAAALITAAGPAGAGTLTVNHAHADAHVLRGLRQSSETCYAEQQPFGSVELQGSQWLGGSGVPVYSNGNTCTVTNVYDKLPNGLKSGMKWQCVELVNRLYLTKGWISRTWSGNGN